MAHTFDLLCAGPFFVDVVMGGLPDGGPELGHELHVDGHQLRAGGVANVALAAAALGGRVAMVTDVGADPLGLDCLEQVRAAGVDVAAVAVHEGWTTPLTVALTWAGDRAQVTSAAPLQAPSALQARELPDSATTVVSLDDAALPWLDGRGGEIIGDLGWDETGAWDLDAYPGLAACTALVPNLAEALALTRTDSLDAALAALVQRVPLAVVTLGPDGADALDRRTGQRVRVAAPTVAVRNANGAGDTFAAAFALAGAAGEGLPARLTRAVQAAASHVAADPSR